MGSIYRESYQIKGYECDYSGKLALSKLIHIVMNASRKQDIDLCVPNIREEKGLAWFVIQHHIDIHTLPRQEETIWVETEAISYNKFFTVRRYSILDQQENVLVNVMTTFALISIEERKMVPIGEDVVSYYQLDPAVSMPKTKRLKVEGELQKSMRYPVRIADIDINGHVNNAVYLEWFVDTLGMAFVHEHTLSSVVIRYEKEIRWGEDVSLNQYSTPSENFLQTVHTIEGASGRHAILCAQWKVK